MATRRGGREQEPGVVWERPEPPEKPAPSPLSRDRIVTAAIGLADADGLTAVSLRKVATELNAGPMRLYGYISTKEELLDLMADRVYAELALPDTAETDWRQRLRLFGGELRQAAIRHEWFVELLGGRPHLGPHALDRAEAVLSTLDEYAGFDIDAAAQALSVFNAYTIGAIQQELSDRRADRHSGMTIEEWQHASYGYLERQLASGRYPTIARMVHAPGNPERGVDFETGLEYVLDGIAARLPG